MIDCHVASGEAQEDQVPAAIEKLTLQNPSSVYLAAALASMAVSVAFKAQKKTDMAPFIGQWAAPFLILGLWPTSSAARYFLKFGKRVPSVPLRDGWDFVFKRGENQVKRKHVT